MPQEHFSQHFLLYLQNDKYIMNEIGRETLEKPVINMCVGVYVCSMFVGMYWWVYTSPLIFMCSLTVNTQQRYYLYRCCWWLIAKCWRMSGFLDMSQCVKIFENKKQNHWDIFIYFLLFAKLIIILLGNMMIGKRRCIQR